ncbi:MAG TPA: PaaX family transcriptional regulator C-terminal domain-containing protein [Anaerolineae bacterium]
MLTSLNESRPVRTQFLIFTLFGDYVIYRGGQIWTTSLLKLMASLGVSERAVRSALSRMTRKSWITSEMYGRHSQYRLTPRGKALLEAGRERIYEAAFSDWDNCWHLLVYSLPEKARRKRHALRTQLTWLGFGHLAPGTWISPRGRHAELEALFSDLRVEPYVDLFSGLYRGPSSARELVERCWDLSTLEEQYRDFIERFQPEYEEYTRQSNGLVLSPELCFVRRFWLTHEFQSFPLKDPNLPPVLLPSDWPGFAARHLFNAYHQLLGTYANQFVDEVMADEDLPSGG